MELLNMLFGGRNGKFPVSRDWQKEFVDFLLESGFDEEGYMKDEKLKKYEVVDRRFIDEDVALPDFYFENDVFIVRTYRPFHVGDDYVRNLPNFIFKPDFLEIKWYRYPLRDAYMSHDINKSEFVEMLEKCRESLK